MSSAFLFVRPYAHLLPIVPARNRKGQRDGGVARDQKHSCQRTGPAFGSDANDNHDELEKQLRPPKNRAPTSLATATHFSIAPIAAALSSPSATLLKMAHARPPLTASHYSSPSVAPFCDRLPNSFDVVSIIRSPCLKSRSLSQRTNSI